MKQMGYALPRRTTPCAKSGMACLLVMLVAIFVLPVAAAETGKGAKVGPTPQYTKQGAKACMRCHSGEIIQVIAKNAHGNKENPGAPYAQHGCESCHGPGSFHVSRAHGGAGFPNMIAFAGNKAAPPAKQIQACQNCHANKLGELEGMKWQGSVHANAKMTCSACHKVHSIKDAMKDREKQARSCFMCHAKTKTEHRRFEDKGINFDALSCWDCHDVHQLSGKK